MKIVQTEFDRTISKLQEILQQNAQEDILGYFICNNAGVIVPNWQDEYENWNKEYTQKIALSHLFLPVKGGTIVTNVGDIGFFYMTKDLYSMWNTAVEKFLAKYLRNIYGVDTLVNGNDVLIDYKKFVGTASGFINDWHIFGCFISMNDDTAWLINKICLKESKYKGFVGLNKYDVCPRKLIQAIINFSKRWEASAL